jgi:hypothetical protein
VLPSGGRGLEKLKERLCRHASCPHVLLRQIISCCE